MRSEVLFIGGRSGVGKTSAAAELHELLKERGVRHAVVEGDNLDLAFPAPHVAYPGFGLAERNLTAMWHNYRELDYRRLVFTNTVSVLEVDRLAEAMGDSPRIIAVLLRATDTTAEARLDRRAGGRASRVELQRSARSALELDEASAERVHRIDTDDMTAGQVASRLAELTGWH